MRSATFNRIQSIARIFHLIDQGHPLTDRDWEMLRLIQSLTVDYDRVLTVLRYLATIEHQASTADLQQVLGLETASTRDAMRAIDYGFPLAVDDRGRSGYWYQPLVVGDNLKLLMGEPIEPGLCPVVDIDGDQLIVGQVYRRQNRKKFRVVNYRIAGECCWIIGINDQLENDQIAIAAQYSQDDVIYSSQLIKAFAREEKQ